jgi:hypothetical protein
MVSLYLVRRQYATSEGAAEFKAMGCAMRDLAAMLRRHKFLAFVGFLLIAELASLPVVYWRYAIRDFPFHAFVDDFIVPRSVIGWWVKPPITEGAPQEYVGNISLRAAKWGEIFPADVILGWRPAANKIARHAFKTDYYVTNSQGFAIVERFDEVYQIPKPQDVFRVIVLGGSTVIGAGVPDSRKALPAKLLGELKRMPEFRSRKVEVINAGVPGFDISQEYLYLLTDLVRYKPDLVVAYHGWNDFGLSTIFNMLGDGASPFQARQFTAMTDRLNRSFHGFDNLVYFAGAVVTSLGEIWSQIAVGHIVRSLARRGNIDLQIRPQAVSRKFHERHLKFGERSKFQSRAHATTARTEFAKTIFRV